METFVGKEVGWDDAMVVMKEVEREAEMEWRCWAASSMGIGRP